MIKNILIIASEPFPNGMAGTNRIISLVKGFQANGLKANVLSIFNYEDPINTVNRLAKGNYEGVAFNNVFRSPVKSRYKLLQFGYELVKPLLVLIYCFRVICKDTLVLYYSPETLSAIAVRIVTHLKGVIFIKEETEHPSIRVRDKDKLSKYLYKKIHYNLFDGMFVITRTLFDYFKFDLKYDKFIIIVPMIVDLNRFHLDSEKSNFKNDQKSIVMSGVLDEQKEGVTTLIEAFSRVAEKHPNYILNFYGEVDEIQLHKFKRKISELQIDANVVIHTYKNRDELTKILNHADILAFTRPPSLQANYGFSTKLGEYLATGRPVLATKVGEVERYLKDKENAFLCDPNCDSIAKCIFEIIDNYDFALAVGEQGLLCANKYFNNVVETKRIIDLVKNQFLKHYDN